MTDDRARVATMFDVLAATYDSTGVDFFQPIARSLAQAMQVRPGERWLDIGCGAGAVLQPVLRAIGPAGSVVGSDISPAMVERCRAAFADEERLTFVVDDAQAPKVVGPFDAVSASLVLFFLPDPLAALRAWRGLLDEGGRLGITTFGDQDDTWDAIDDLFNPFLPRQMLDARTSGAEGPFASDAGVEELLRAAGLGHVHTVTDSIDVRFADASQWEAFSWTTGQRAMWMAVPEDARPALREAAFDLLATRAAADGSITLQQGIRHTLGRVR